MTRIYSEKYMLEKGWQALLKDLNISVQDVLRYAQLPLDLFLRKTPSVTSDEYFRFWDGLAYTTKSEPAFALRLVENINAKTTDPALIAFLSSSNLNIALKRIAHYKPVVAPIYLKIEQDEQQTSVTFSELPQHRPLPPLFIAFELTFWVQLARIATREQIHPKAVHVSLDLPALEAYESFLGIPIWADDINQVVFSASDAQRPFLTANHTMWEILEPAFNKRMEDLNPNVSFRECVRTCLIEMLASGECTLSSVASKLAISNRTLQRRLRQEDTNFQKVLDELREELACHYLWATDYSGAEISFLLGYEEPNSFFRAFRTWTGQTPEVVRANR